MQRLYKISIFLLLFSCSHAVHIVNLSDHEMKKSLQKGKLIKAETFQTVFMGFKFDTDYVNFARNQLMAQCPNGNIKNIMTRASTSHGFFHWKNKVYMEARCFN